MFGPGYTPVAGTPTYVTTTTTKRVPATRRRPARARKYASTQPPASGGRLDAMSGAAASAAAILAPWAAYEAGMTPGVADGSVNATYRVWSNTKKEVTSLVNAVSGQYSLRIAVAPTPSQKIREYTTWTSGTPGATDNTADEIYAALAGAGVVYYRVVAMGFRATNITQETNLEGALYLTQQRLSLVDSSSATVVLNLTPGLVAAANRAGVTAQQFWIPPSDNNPFRAIATGMGNTDSVLIIQTETAAPQTYEIETFTLYECQSVGESLVEVTPFIGSPTVCAEAIGNSLARLPHYAIARNMITNSAVSRTGGLKSAIKGTSIGKALDTASDIFDVDIIKEAGKWLKEAAKEYAPRAIAAAGDWISGLFGATGATPDEFRIAGMIVSLGRERARVLATTAAAHPAEDELYQWAEGVLLVNGHILVNGTLRPTASSKRIKPDHDKLLPCSTTQCDRDYDTCGVACSNCPYFNG